MSETIWRYGVIVQGVRKRCRKSERHAELKLGQDSEPNETLAKEIAKTWVNSNMKTVEKAFATATRFTIKDDCELWEPFTKEDNLRFPLD